MPVDLGQRIRDLRVPPPGEIPLYTQPELGRLVGVGSISVSRWERGEAVPKPEHLRALATVFRVPISYFYEEAPQPVKVR